jgi:hypothetical protein
MKENAPFDESELANAIGLLVIKSSHLDYLLRYMLAAFIAEDITDNRIYEKAELIVTKFVKISHVVGLLNDLVPRVLCAWYWDDFYRLFEDVGVVVDKRNRHCHDVFFILDEDTYCRRSNQNQPVMVESKPATFLSR